jgi:hypothetical protein
MTASRRSWLRGLSVAAAAAFVSACDRIAGDPGVRAGGFEQSHPDLLARMTLQAADANHHIHRADLHGHN